MKRHIVKVLVGVALIVTLCGGALGIGVRTAAPTPVHPALACNPPLPPCW